MSDPANPEAQALSLRRGRIALRLTWTFLGEDLAVTLGGGDRAHIGAVAVSRPGAASSVIALPGHREDELARTLADRLAACTGAVVCVACGIHLERIRPAEIAEVLAMAAALADQLAERLTAP